MSTGSKLGGRLVAALVLAAALAASAAAQARIAEIADIEGVRENQVRGAGLVIGLRGTGDRSAAARRIAANMLRRFNVNLTEKDVNSANVAVVLVTATLPPFVKSGSRIDVTVSSLQDAASLFGGVLVATPLTGFDPRQVYAVAEGPLSVGGVSAEGQSGSSSTVNHPTVGRITGGALVEEEVEMRLLADGHRVHFRLRDPSFITAGHVERAINTRFPGSARAVDGATVALTVPAARRQDLVGFIAEVQGLRAEVDVIGKIVINERTGTIVAGENVMISTVVISHGNLSISVAESWNVSQPEAFSGGRTTVTPQSDVSIQESQGTGLRVLKGGVTVAQMADALNQLGVSPRDIVTIFQAIRAAGAIQAEVVMQ